MMNRLLELPTLRINPERKLAFYYRGKKYQAFAGDSVASALYASGIRIFGRSHKYHRPRGLYSLNAECSNCMMQIDGTANMNAEITKVRDGMQVWPQNAFPSPDLDLFAFMDKLHWLMPAGFYYQSMHKPAFLWPFAAAMIRKGAGLGRISPDFELKEKFEQAYMHTQVLVIGGGISGMQAALAAAGSGADVLLLEARPWLGGVHAGSTMQGEEDLPLWQKVKNDLQRLRTAGNIAVYPHTYVLGAYNDNLITALQEGGEGDHFRQRYLEIRAGSVVLATGQKERPLIFEHNDRPGVMQTGCARDLAALYGVLPGEKAVFAVGHDLGLETAIELNDLGTEVQCVADIRENMQNPRLQEMLEQRGIPLLKGWTVKKVQGGKRLKHALLTCLSSGKQKVLSCDVLAASAGLSPNYALASMLPGCVLGFDYHTNTYMPRELPENMRMGGRILGYSRPRDIEQSGYLAGLKAAGDCGFAPENDVPGLEHKLQETGKVAKNHVLVAGPGRKSKAFICFDEDATLKHIHQSLDKGLDQPELIKRFAAIGTGPGQSGIPGQNLPLYLSQITHKDYPEIKPTSIRPPLWPALMAAYAGPNHDICKRTPLHQAQKQAGGYMERVGVWKRARYFSQDRQCRQEVKSVRENLGIMDVSTLGKFRVFGPNALDALQRVYVGDMRKITAGKVKYSAMCNHDGCLVDDGVVLKLGENDYYLTTSTARAGMTAEWIRYHTRYEDWDFHLLNLTDAYGAINLAGPKARELLSRVTGADISPDNLPFLGHMQLHIRDKIPVRILRLGFVGELSFEIHVPASYLHLLWQLLLQVGQDLQPTVFGLEAQNILRLEKGHVIIGSESEQRTTLHDLGMGKLWARALPDRKVGAPALRQTENQSGRLKLTGIKMLDSERPPRDKSIIVADGIRGYVCTARYSPSLQEVVGLALIEDSLLQKTKRFAIREDGSEEKYLHARAVATPFYDPEGSRMKM